MKTVCRYSYIKSFAAAFLLLLAVFIFVSGCAYGKEPEGSEKCPGRVVVEIFPYYDWVLNIVGDNPGNLDISLLIENGTDMHSFQPGVHDIISISSCDLLIYTGGESDEWVNDAASEAVNENLQALKLLDMLGDNVLAEEELPGITSKGRKADHLDEEPDEHIWLSLKNAEKLCLSIADALSQIDPENEQFYHDNALLYIDKLNKLDEQYKGAVNSSQFKTLVFADRFPFRYLTQDYGLEYYAAFKGCSAESEAGFDTIIFLAQKVDELSLRHVMVIDGSDQKLAKTVVKSTKDKDQTILTLDSIQSVTASDIASGISYYDIMTQNLEVLKQALDITG